MRVENAAKPWLWDAPRLQNHLFYNGLEAPKPCFLGLEAVKPHSLRGFVAFLARKSLSGGLREASGGALEAPEAARRLPLGAKADFWMIVGAIVGSPNRSILSWNLIKNGAPPWSDNLGHLEASGGGLGLDVGFILGSILSFRAP